MNLKVSPNALGSNAKQKVVLSWSSGKDSMLALHKLLERPDLYEVGALLLTCTPEEGVGTTHHTPLYSARAQAEALGIRLIELDIGHGYSGFNEAIIRVSADLSNEGFTLFATGDIALQDGKEYRDNLMAKTRLTPIYPLWDLPTVEVAQDILNSKIRAKVAVIQSDLLPHSFLGRDYDHTFLYDLAQLNRHRYNEGERIIDPCGEFGEFHTIAYSSPYFKHPLNIEKDGHEYSAHNKRYAVQRFRLSPNIYQGPAKTLDLGV